MANPAPKSSPGNLEEAYQQKLAEQRGQFQAVVDEANAALKAFRELLDEERRKREAAQAELENLQKGSVAMMKYVTNLQRKKHDEELAALERELEGKRGRRSAPPSDEDDIESRQTAIDNLEAYVADRYRLLEKARDKGGNAAASAALDARERALDRREDELDGRKRDLDEQFQKLKEERELRFAEADAAFTSEMGKLPEMQRLIVERDDMIRDLTAKAEADASELRTMRLRESLAKANLNDLPGGPELERRLAEWSDTNVALRHRLAQKEKELEEVKREFEIKMRNTIALQRIRYETEIKELREGRRGRVGLLRPKRGG